MGTQAPGGLADATAAARQDQAASIRGETATSAPACRSRRAPSAGVADNVGSEDRRQFALLSGQWNFALLQRIVEGPAGQSSAKVVNQQALGTAKIDPQTAAFNVHR
jgi:hypothetical protein